jgi:hypothetical protein
MLSKKYMEFILFRTKIATASETISFCHQLPNTKIIPEEHHRGIMQILGKPDNIRE